MAANTNDILVFIGYFSSNNSKRSIARYVLDLCPRAGKISVHSRAVGTTGKVLRVSLAFRRISDALSAVKTMNEKGFHGAPLAARLWVERDGFNDRRTPGWRDRPWGGGEQRKSERRVYKAPTEFPDSLGVAGRLFMMTEPVRPQPPSPTQAQSEFRSDNESLLPTGRHSSSALNSQLEEFGIFRRA